MPVKILPDKRQLSPLLSPPHTPKITLPESLVKCFDRDAIWEQISINSGKCGSLNCIPYWVQDSVLRHSFKRKKGHKTPEINSKAPSTHPQDRFSCQRPWKDFQVIWCSMTPHQPDTVPDLVPQEQDKEQWASLVLLLPPFLEEHIPCVKGTACLPAWWVVPSLPFILQLGAPLELTPLWSDYSIHHTSGWSAPSHRSLVHTPNSTCPKLTPLSTTHI